MNAGSVSCSESCSDGENDFTAKIKDGGGPMGGDSCDDLCPDDFGGGDDGRACPKPSACGKELGSGAGGGQGRLAAANQKRIPQIGDALPGSKEEIAAQMSAQQQQVAGSIAPATKASSS